MLDKVRTFVKVAEAGSFSKAGGQLNMAPSSVTRKIDSLEAELGGALFRRTTRQLILTEKGNRFLAGARQLVLQADSLIASIQTNKLEPEGTIRVSVFESFGRLHVCPVLPEFVSRYPQVRVELELENRLVDLAADEIDLAIRIGRPVDSGLRARRLLSNHTVLCASPLYLETHTEPVTPEDLSEHNCLALSQKRQQTYWHFHKGKQHRKVLVTGNISSTGGTPLLAAAEQGAGLVMLANWMVADSLKKGTLQAVMPDWGSSLHGDSSGEIAAVYMNSRYTKPALRVFIDYLVEKTRHKGFNQPG